MFPSDMLRPAWVVAMAEPVSMTVLPTEPWAKSLPLTQTWVIASIGPSQTARMMVAE